MLDASNDSILLGFVLEFVIVATGTVPELWFPATVNAVPLANVEVKVVNAPVFAAVPPIAVSVSE